MNLPEHEVTKLGDGRVRIAFDPPITKSRLGIPFSFLVLQQKTANVASNRFGRVSEIECEARHWVSYLKTRGTLEETIEAFKRKVGYTDPKPENSEASADAPAKDVEPAGAAAEK